MSVSPSRIDRSDKPSVSVPPSLRDFARLALSGQAPDIAAEWRDVEAYNTLSWRIYDAVAEGARAAHELLASAGASPFRNLTVLLWHKLITEICSSAFLHYEAQVAPVAGLTLSAHMAALEEAYTAPDLKAKLELRLKNLILQVDSGALLQRNVNVVGYAPNLTIQPRHLAKSLASLATPMALRKLVADKMSFPKLNDQLEILRTTVLAAGRAAHLPAAELETLAARFVAWGQSLHTEHESPLACAVVVSGSTVEASSRLIAAKARAQAIPVISLWHGGGCGILDEPFIGYGEHFYPNELIVYGKYKAEDIASAYYQCPITESRPDHPRMTAPYIRKIYEQHGRRTQIAYDPRRIRTVLYAPTSFSGHFRYGPYRDCPDVVYLDWQIRMLKCLAEQWNVIWKLHRKDKIIAGLDLQHSRIRIEQEQSFETMLEQADAFVLDFAGSAFITALATDKPVINFNIGLRRFTPPAWDIIRKRCLTLDIDLKAPHAALESHKPVLFGQPREFVNYFTDLYSLSEPESAPLDVLKERVQRQCSLPPL